MLHEKSPLFRIESSIWNHTTLAHIHCRDPKAAGLSADLIATISFGLALSKTSGRSLEAWMGRSMRRQPELNSPIQVVGNAAQQGLLNLLPLAARRNCPAQSALDNRDEHLDFPPLAIALRRKASWSWRR
jgi:hypothetical protein